MVAGPAVAAAVAAAAILASDLQQLAVVAGWQSGQGTFVAVPVAVVAVTVAEVAETGRSVAVGLVGVVVVTETPGSQWSWTVMGVAWAAGVAVVAAADWWASLAPGRWPAGAADQTCTKKTHPHFMNSLLHRYITVQGN